MPRQNRNSAGSIGIGIAPGKAMEFLTDEGEFPLRKPSGSL
jgi:hypothetical protein